MKTLKSASMSHSSG